LLAVGAHAFETLVVFPSQEQGLGSCSALVAITTFTMHHIAQVLHLAAMSQRVGWIALVMVVTLIGFTHGAQAQEDMDQAGIRFGSELSTTGLLEATQQ